MSKKGPLFVWICGTIKAEFFGTQDKFGRLRAWELNGVFTKKEDAVARCKTANDFVAKVRFNYGYSERTTEIDSTEYPLAKGKW